MPIRSLIAAAAVLCATGALAAPPLLPVTPAPVELISARPFTLGEPLPVPGRPDLERSHDGLLLVLAVEPSLVWPRQSAQPVLYAGDSLALRANHGWPSGRLVVGVIGTRELEGLRVWFGSPGLPERADADRISAENEIADAAGLEPFSRLAIERALTAGGAALELDDASGLESFVVGLLNEHDPNRPGAQR